MGTPVSLPTLERDAPVDFGKLEVKLHKDTVLTQPWSEASHFPSASLGDWGPLSAPAQRTSCLNKLARGSPKAKDAWDMLFSPGGWDGRR